MGESESNDKINRKKRMKGKIMRKSIILTVAFLLILSIFIAGCTSISSTSIPTPVQTTAIQLSTIDPSEMALTLSDVPAGFTIKEGSERTSSDMSQEAHANGWEKGYYVQFERSSTGTNTGVVDFEILEQTISVYPIDNVNQVLDERGPEILQTANTTFKVEQLSDPEIGDSSAAFRIKTSYSGVPINGFDIIFVKKDVYEEVASMGTSADYETLKNLANVSASKI